MTAAPEDLHPLVRAAGTEGRLPDWARCSEGRRAHVERVAGLLDRWGEALELEEGDRIRWRAAGILHDALREAGAEELRFWSDRDWPLPVMHAPACAGRLREEGVEDEELLEAIAHHPVGKAGLGRLGRHLYLADFLEPGREFLEEVRERLRAILPGQAGEGMLSVTALRLAHRLEVRGGIHRCTVEMWNWLLEETDEERVRGPGVRPGRSAAGTETG